MTQNALQTGILREQFPLGEERETVLGEIDSRARECFPFYFRLPYDDPIALLKWRIYVRKRCVKDVKFRAAVNEMCRLDCAFYIVTFCCIFEPRPFPHKLPFFLWPDQVSVLAWWTECFGVRSSGSEKTRGIGFSWLGMAFLKHKWDYVDGVQIALVSEDTDKLGGGGKDIKETNSLLGKLQFLHDNAPAWMQYTKSGHQKLYRVGEKMMFVNQANAALFQGFSSRQAKLRSLRFTVIFADEFGFYARTDQDEWNTAAFGTCPCVMAVSTWNTHDDLFNEFMYGKESSMLRIRAFWWNNPERYKGAYRIINGQTIIVDKTYNWQRNHPAGYNYGAPEVTQLEGELRSPWIDYELSQPGRLRDILKTLRDYYGRRVCEQTTSFFPYVALEAADTTTAEPTTVGLLDTTGGTVTILPTHKGDIRCWDGVPTEDKGPYTMGLDLGEGVGAANSVAQVLGARGEQVLQYGRNDRRLADFVADCVIIARWLARDKGDGWVKFDFESNAQYAKIVREELDRHYYGNVHMSKHKRQRGEKLEYAGTINPDGGFTNFQELQRAILALETRIRSTQVVSDMKLMGRDDNGKPSFPRNHETGHGDYLYAYALAWWRMRDSTQTENVVQLEVESPPPGTILVPAREPSGFQGPPTWSSAWQ